MRDRIFWAVVGAFLAACFLWAEWPGIWEELFHAR